MRIWTVRLKRTINPSAGLAEGFTIQVQTQQNSPCYPDLEKALKSAGITAGIGGCASDYYWDWM
ncbi:hypothetical protein [Prevotella intermedia]|uniref:hypothetical protein n=1 Tax=Prevotella intermedia TaxID=28131 RepID=UPI000C239DF0|nr:hypothetical protein [Prevotella intermedia]